MAALKLLEERSFYSVVEVWDGARKVFPRARQNADIAELKRTLASAGLAVVEDDPAPQH